MQIAAIEYWHAKGQTQEQIAKTLVTPHELSDETRALVEAYATTLGVSPVVLREKYARAPLSWVRVHATFPWR